MDELDRKEPVLGDIAPEAASAADEDAGGSTGSDAGATVPPEASPVLPDGADPIAALIRLTAEHATAAASGSPDQPRLLAARKAVSRLIQDGDYSIIANLAVRSPAHLAVVEADTREAATPEFSHDRIGRLMGDHNWNSASDATRSSLADPAEFYIQAKRRFATLSSSAVHAYGDAAELDLIAKRYAEGLVRSGRIVDLAMRNEGLALAAMADAGLSRELTTQAAIAAKEPLARAYLDADQRIIRALDERNWSAYGAAAEERMAAMAAMAGDPGALVALGRMAAQRNIELRAKAAADLTAIRAASDPHEQERFQTHLKEFEDSFIQDMTIEGSDPLRRWIKIQNEIERQERGATVDGPNLAYLRKLSEKTALEVAARPSDWARLQQTRPDLNAKLVVEGNKRRENAMTLGKESTLAQTPEGATVVNEAAAARNAGESPEEAAAKPDAERVDPQAQEIRTRRRMDAEDERAAPASKPDEATKSTLRADPADRILKGEPASGTKRQAPAQPAAMQHKMTKHPEFEVDKGPYERTPGRDLGAFVHSRAPYSIATLDGQLSDPRKLVFAVPLNSFASDKVWRIKKKLKKIATKDPERFKAMYSATKGTWHHWQDAPGERNRVALDQLEIGRRILAEVGVKAKLLPVDKAVRNARQLQSNASRAMDHKSKFDPHGFIERAQAKSLASYYLHAAGSAASAKAKEYQKDSYRKLKLNLAGIPDDGHSNISLKTAVARGASRSGKAVLDYVLGELDRMAR